MSTIDVVSRRCALVVATLLVVSACNKSNNISSGSTTCDIDGVVVTGSAANPANACETCQPSVSSSSWTNETEGTSCGLGKVCHAVVCVEGCDIGETYYPAGASSPADPCQTCDPSTSTQAWGSLPSGASCGEGRVCNGGVCASGCYIAGVVYAAAGANPNNPCEYCRPATSSTAWTGADDGTTCGNGQVCQLGICGAACNIGGAIVASGVSSPTDPCKTCQPGVTTAAWTQLANGSSCGAGVVCSSDMCIPGCTVGGAVYAPDAPNPGNECQSCQPSASTAEWTNAAPGVSCGNGQVCNQGTCSLECFIDNTIYASGAHNPASVCQICEPGTSTQSWTTLPPGTSCGAGQVCDGTTCFSGCLIGDVHYAAGQANPNNTCQSCEPATSTNAWTNAVADGTSCAVGAVCQSGDCLAGCSIGAVIYPPFAMNPNAVCQQYCAPDNSTTTWSSVPNGASCGAEQWCFDGGCSATPPSCLPAGAGTSACGASSESCCSSTPIPGGTFSRTYSNIGAGPFGEQDPATVSGFHMDKYEVTVGRFRQFATAWNAGWTPAAGSGKHIHLNGGRGLVNSASPGTYETGWLASDTNNLQPTDANLHCNPTSETWTTTAGANESLPMNCINWWDAYAFCIWDGGFLPSAAEWGYAAAGGSQEREYPWGTAAPGTMSLYAIWNCDYPNGVTNCTGLANIAPVGTTAMGAGLWGQFDLAGSVWEWNLDTYESTYANPCVDCVSLGSGSSRVVRGGGFATGSPGTAPDTILPPYRKPVTVSSRFGFRCIRTP